MWLSWISIVSKVENIYYFLMYEQNIMSQIFDRPTLLQKQLNLDFKFQISSIPYDTRVQIIHF